MEDGQDHQGGGEIGADSVAMPVAHPSAEPVAQAAADEPVFEAANTDDADDASGLTGVLAALESEDDAEETAAVEPTPTLLTESIVEPAPQPEPEAAVLPESASEPGPEPEPEAGPEPDAEPEVEAAVEHAPVPDVHETPQVAGVPAFFPEDQRGVPIWPFLAYFAIWVIFAGLLVWQFMQTPAGVPLYERALYGPSILAGLVLTAIGPLLAVGVWFMLWLARPSARAGLFSRSLIIGAVVTLVGVALWLIALGAVDMLRLGRLI